MQSLTSEVHTLMKAATQQAILPHYQSLLAHEINAKAADDVVTVADHESEAILTEGLARLLPEATIVGEEAYHANPALIERLSDDLCWIIDPLDGTNNFAAGRPHFGVIVALAERGEAVAGWIYDCLSGRFCHAHLGKGAFMDGERLQARTSGTDLPIAAISTIFVDPERREAIRSQIAPYYTFVDIPRCAAEQYPRLALGQNDIAVFERTLAWDHAAGALFLNEAGGKVARPDGRAYRVDEHLRPGLIGASSPALWDELVARLDGGMAQGR